MIARSTRSGRDARAFVCVTSSRLRGPEVPSSARAEQLPVQRARDSTGPFVTAPRLDVTKGVRSSDSPTSGRSS